MLHERTLIHGCAIALASCGTQASDHALLSATRLTLTERETASVDVDLADGADFEVSAPPTVAIVKSTDPGRPSFTLTPSCDATNGPDVTIDVEVSANGRTATLLLDVVDDRTVGCFKHVDIQGAFSISSLACADLVGDGGFEVVIGGSELVIISSLDSTAPPQMVPLTGSIPQTYAMKTVNGLDIIGVSVPDEKLVHLVGTSWQPWLGSPKVGNGLVGLRSPSAPSVDPDFLVGWDVDPITLARSAYFTALTAAGTSSTTALPLFGTSYALGTYGNAQSVLGVQVGGPSQQANKAFVLDLTWKASGTEVTGLTTDGSPQNQVLLDPPTAVNQGAAVVSVVPRTGPSGDDLLIGIQANFGAPFDTAVDELQFTPGLELMQAYGGVRSIAATPDGGVLLGADRGAVLTRYVGSATTPVYQLIDLYEAQPTVHPSRDYASAIAPCLDHDGRFAGFVITADGSTVRVAGPPDLP